MATIVLATVDICMSQPEDMGNGAWRWALVPGVNPVGSESVWRPEGLESALIAYGAVIAQSAMVRRQRIQRGTERFRLTAHGRYTGLTRGEYILRWHPKARRFVPAGPPLIAWPSLDDVTPDVRALLRRLDEAAYVPWWERAATTHGAGPGGVLRA